MMGEMSDPQPSGLDAYQTANSNMAVNKPPEIQHTKMIKPKENLNSMNQARKERLVNPNTGIPVGITKGASLALQKQAFVGNILRGGGNLLGRSMQSASRPIGEFLGKIAPRHGKNIVKGTGKKVDDVGDYLAFGNPMMQKLKGVGPAMKSIPESSAKNIPLAKNLGRNLSQAISRHSPAIRDRSTEVRDILMKLFGGR